MVDFAKASLTKLLEDARAINGRLAFYQRPDFTWTVGIFFFGGRRYEWVGSPDLIEALSKVIKTAKREVQHDVSDLA